MEDDRVCMYDDESEDGDNDLRHLQAEKDISQNDDATRLISHNPKANHLNMSYVKDTQKVATKDLKRKRGFKEKEKEPKQHKEQGGLKSESDASTSELEDDEEFHIGGTVVKEKLNLKEMESIKNYTCLRCLKAFEKYGILQQHLKECGAEKIDNVSFYDYEDGKYTCNFCGFLIFTKSYVLEHLKYHMNANSYDCNCGEKFDFPEVYIKHFKACPLAKYETVQESQTFNQDIPPLVDQPESSSSHNHQAFRNQHQTSHRYSNTNSNRVTEDQYTELVYSLQIKKFIEFCLICNETILNPDQYTQYNHEAYEEECKIHYMTHNFISNPDIIYNVLKNNDYEKEQSLFVFNYSPFTYFHQGGNPNIPLAPYNNYRMYITNEKLISAYTSEKEQKKEEKKDQSDIVLDKYPIEHNEQYDKLKCRYDNLTHHIIKTTLDSYIYVEDNEWGRKFDKKFDELVNDTQPINSKTAPPFMSRFLKSHYQSKVK